MDTVYPPAKPLPPPPQTLGVPTTTTASTGLKLPTPVVEPYSPHYPPLPEPDPDWQDHAKRRYHLYTDPAKYPSKAAAKAFPSNYISTTKYNILTFLPKNLFEQFRRVSNFYFLVNMIFALIPGVSPTFPITSIIPLVFVLVVAATKDAYEDYGRYKADRRANGAPVTAIRNGVEVALRSDQLVVGDFVKVHKNSELAADIVVLSSALDDGICYIETANLDGETNIKPRQALNETRHLCEGPAFTSSSARSIHVECDAPNESLVKWEGVLEIDGEIRPLSLRNILFRGCGLRNTPYIYGLIIYCGTDTKLFQNYKKKAAKFSSLDKRLNWLIIFLLAVQLSIIAILTALNLYFGYFRSSEHNAFFLDEATSKVALYVLQFMTYFVLLSYMMPISLFVSMELCKSFQAKFMEFDLGMATATKTMKVKTSNLNEELSQVKYIFSDKTGTLTDNEMRFHSASVAGFYNNEQENPGGIGTHLRNGSAGGGGGGGVAQHVRSLYDYMLVLSLCHTVVCSKNDATGEIIYEGQSTDEVAFVNMAKNNGFTLLERTANYFTIEILGKVYRYEILALCDFTSDRKRMTLLVRCDMVANATTATTKPAAAAALTESALSTQSSNTTTMDPTQVKLGAALTNAQMIEGEILLLIKGADNTMLPIIHRSTPADHKWYHHTVHQLDNMAKQGLRTLVVGIRRLSKTEYSTWKAKFDQASLALQDRDAKVAEASALIEQNVELLGCSGIEDRLQDRVPETIAYLLNAGIVIWILTGDKRGTLNR